MKIFLIFALFIAFATSAAEYGAKKKDKCRDIEQQKPVCKKVHRQVKKDFALPGSRQRCHFEKRSHVKKMTVNVKSDSCKPKIVTQKNKRPVYINNKKCTYDKKDKKGKPDCKIVKEVKWVKSHDSVTKWKCEQHEEKKTVQGKFYTTEEVCENYPSEEHKKMVVDIHEKQCHLEKYIRRVCDDDKGVTYYADGKGEHSYDSHQKKEAYATTHNNYDDDYKGYGDYGGGNDHKGDYGGYGDNDHKNNDYSGHGDHNNKGDYGYGEHGYHDNKDDYGEYGDNDHKNNDYAYGNNDHKDEYGGGYGNNDHKDEYGDGYGNNDHKDEYGGGYGNNDHKDEYGYGYDNNDDKGDYDNSAYHKKLHYGAKDFKDDHDYGKKNIGGYGNHGPSGNDYGDVDSGYGDYGDYDHETDDYGYGDYGDYDHETDDYGYDNNNDNKDDYAVVYTGY